MFADIVSLTPADPTKNFFTYKVPNSLSKSIVTGLLVSVPWGKKTTQGIVIEIKKETQVKKLKRILKILHPTPLLLPQYIELLKWMAWYYHAPMLDCFKTMLPELPLSAKRLTTNAKSDKAFAISHQKSVSRSAFGVRQTLILVPTINQIEAVLKQLNTSKSINTKNSILKDTIIYHKQLSKKELWKVWWKVLNGNANKIIGTRSALFVQCPNLEEIKIIGEEESGFKDIQSPYFDTLTVAAKLAKLAAAKLKIESLTPRPETYFNFSKKIKKSKLGVKPKITLVDLFSQRKTDKNSLIEKTLKKLLTEKINQKKPVLLFLNRIKEAGQIYCTECKFSGYSPTPPEICPNCKGANFKFFSLNLKSVGNQISKIFPKVGLRLVSLKKTKILKKGKPAITLATNTILSQSGQKFSAIAVILADTILNLPDFASSFRTFSTLVKLSQLSNKEGEVIIQTYNPYHPSIKFAANYDFERYYQDELILRKKLGLPPFSTLVKVIIKFKKVQKAQAEAEKLKLTLEKRSLLVEVSDVIESWQGLVPSGTGQGKPEFNIILKAEKRQDLDRVLDYIPGKFKVVVDPESLL